MNDFWHVIWPAFWFGVSGACIGYWSCAWIQHRIAKRRARKQRAAAARHSINLPPYRKPPLDLIDIARRRRNLHIHTGFNHDD